MIKINEQKFDIIVIAGQSNAEGNGVSTDDTVETRTDVYEVVDCNECYLTEDKKVVCTQPTKCKVQCLQERMANNIITSDFSFSFVDAYINSGLLEKDRKLLVVKTAIGGSGFALNQQGKNNPLGIRAKEMIKFALNLNKNNRIVAYLWHQGEHDAFEFADLDESKRYDNYHKAFMEQTNDVLETFSQFKFPVISGEFVNEWADLEENKVHTATIERCLKDCMNEIGFAGFVSSKNLKSNNQEIGNGDNIHFSKKSLVELGKRYFEVFYKLIKK